MKHQIYSLLIAIPQQLQLSHTFTFSRTPPSSPSSSCSSVVTTTFRRNQLLLHSTSSAAAINDDDTNKNMNTDDDDDSEDLLFPAPLSPLDRVKRAAAFWSTAVPIVAQYYGTSTELLLRERFLGQCLSDEECEVLWDTQHEKGAEALYGIINQLKGFYVKTAQIISSRQDLFPSQYTEKLSGFTDQLDPMPASLAKAVIKSELLNADENFEDVFVEFDEEPLGSASIGQVHRAVLSKKYGGKEVAVKVQRPEIEPKLMGDIANLKALAKTLESALPLDYYTVFAELEKQLGDEFDFVKEAVAMDRIYTALTRSNNGSTTPAEVPLVIPKPIPGLVCRRVLVMDYLKGVPLSRAAAEMKKRGMDPDSPESKIFARKLLGSLTYVFGRSILETGFFHADPHPGNIFVLEDGNIGLIDFGQVKQISGRNRMTLAKVMLALANRKSDDNPDDLKLIGDLAVELGVEIKEDAKPEAACATAMWIFDGSVEKMPGGYDKGELSPNSPVKELKSFPQDLVLVGRSCILIKGLSSRMNIPWSLAKEWAPIAQTVLDPMKAVAAASSGGESRTRFRQVTSSLKLWAKGRIERTVQKLPPPVRTRILSVVVRIQDSRRKKKLMSTK